MQAAIFGQSKEYGCRSSKLNTKEKGILKQILDLVQRYETLKLNQSSEIEKA